MAKQFATLESIDKNEEITLETHFKFLYQLQKALLLALHERGRLNGMEYRIAEDKLKQQRIVRAKAILGKEEIR